MRPLHPIRIVNQIFKFFTTTRRRKILSVLLALLVLLTSIRLIFLKPEEVKAADIYLGLNEGYGTSANDTNSTISAGTITNALWKTEDLCKFGKCLYFDGTGDYVSFADNSNLDMAASDMVTIEFWFRTPDISAGTRTLISKEETTGTDGGYRIQMNSSGQIVFGIDNDNTSFPLYSVTSTSSYDDNFWHFIAVVKSGTSSITLYIDGQSVGTTSITSTDASNDDTFYIGIYNGSSDGFTGFIDEVKVIRSARSTNEIKADFLGETPSRGVSASFGGSNQSFLSDGLVGYWKMDESSGNASDSSGNGTTLTDVNTVTFTGGKFGNAGDFESTASEYQYAADNSALSITGSLTLAAWIRPESVTAGSYNIIAKWDGTNESYRLFQNGDEIRLELDSAGNYQETTSANLAASTWYHIVGVYNPTSATAKIYINGTEVSSSTTGTIPTSIGDDTGRFHIGAEDSTSTAANFYDGIIDEARVYNRALSPAEVKALYEWAPGPIAHWKLDENTGQFVYDSSTKGNNGTLGDNSNVAADDPTWFYGKFGSSLDFENTSTEDYVCIQNSGTSGSPLDIANNGRVTVSAWVKAESFPANDSNAYIASKGYSFPYETYSLRINTDGSGNKYLQFGSYSALTGQDYMTSWSISGWNTGEWHHVSGVYDGSTWYVYFDGIQKASTTTTGPFSNTTTFEIGAMGGPQDVNGNCTNSERYWDGLIDDVRVYNYARTPSQIIEDMNAGHPAPGSPISSATAYWKFDEGYGTTAYDTGISGSNLTLSSASWTNSGKFGKAFNGGNNQRVAGTDDSDFEPGSLESFAISAWFKSDGSTTAATEYLVSKGGSGIGGYQIYFNTSGQVICGIDDDATSFPEDSATTTNDYYDQSWHHMVCVRDITADKLYLYIDGRLVAEDSDLSATGSLATTSTFYLNDQNATDGTDEFLGDIDDVRFYRSNITSEEVKLLYNQGSSAVWGTTSTDSSGNASWSAENEYCPPGQGSTCTPPVAEWNFDENTGTTAYDSSGNSNTATLYNGPTWVAGKTGQALSFDGGNSADDYIDAGSGSSIDNIFDAGGTISFWTYIRSDGELDSGRILNKILGPSGWELHVQAQSGNYVNLKFYVYFSGGSSGQWTLLASSSHVPINRWIQITLTYNNDSYANDPMVYIDGILKNWDVDSNPSSGQSYQSDASNNLTIGSDSSSHLATFDGIIDQVRFYDYVRTPAQIAWDYYRGKPQGFWKFDENTGTTAYDSSGNGYNSQTFTGNTTWSTGKLNTALTFDGADDVVRITEGAGIDFGATTDNYSISAWFKTSADYTTNPGTIVAKNDGTGVYPFDLQINTSEQPCIVMNDGTTRTLCGTQTVNDGAWHLITAVRNVSADTVTLYLDGVQVNSTTDSTTSSMENNDDVSIGNSGTGTYTTNDFNGSIDDVRIFNYNLNAYQVKLLYSENSSLRFGPSSGSP